MFNCLYFLDLKEMAKVHIVDVKVLNNPCPFFSPFQFEIVFECIDEIPEGKPFDLSSFKNFLTISFELLWQIWSGS